jgi:hypothetical protein
LYKGYLISSNFFSHINIYVYLELSEMLVLEQGNGTWEAQLRIMRVTTEDVDRRYVLRARNDVGEQQYTVKISTSAEPQGIRHGL